ncbi:hypothetical protein CFC21_043043 [Triticum aestivum]|uniref:Uncharacterized protein n=3 Tax=Triticum TaxID=4564 RepID=D8L9L7_WHEAT|nr:uncharacterized protein LOC119281786 [Triticum dicoccoides]XP_044345109.1 uncharacterized protein LOC123065997 [Triticum aestivum]VAH82200.1 unnamed protein product [Triticum turgidum subsp. durum]KAF7031765.1 hypothetical protein CFC21_043043 [Triticum aestivum]CBH32571.1 hypothetical protein, expressed [Triticum aestivum]CDM85143.1 unnamed protein product [Triticum aestivum]
MSVGKKPSPSTSRHNAEEAVQEVEGGDNGRDVAVMQRKESGSRSGGKKAADQRRYRRCFSGLEISIGPGPLKDVDAGKLKGQIRKWARAVVGYARQLSFGSPRSSPRKSGDGVGATPKSAAVRSKYGLSGARSDPPSAVLPP